MGVRDEYDKTAKLIGRIHSIAAAKLHIPDRISDHYEHLDNDIDRIKSPTNRSIICIVHD